MANGETDARLTARTWGVLLALCGALFLDALDVSMKGVALPAIRTELVMSAASSQWIIGAYTLGFGSLLLLGGRVADLYGRRRTFVASLVVFLAASAAGGLAGNGALLVAARFATGASAAFTAPAGLSIITTSFAEGPLRTRALSIYSATGAAGFSLGLVAGGLLSELDWRLVFFVPVLLAALTIVAARRLIPDRGRPIGAGSLDIPGAATVTTGLLLLVLALVRTADSGWLAASTLILFAAAAATFAAFALIERRSRQPLLRPGLLRSGRLIQANVGAMALLGGWVGALFIVTLYLQQIRDWSPLQTGVAVAPTGVVVVVLAPRIAGPLVARFGTRRVILAGLCAAAVAYSLLLSMGWHGSYPAVMLPSFLLVGLAFALAYGPLNIAATEGIDAAEQGVASALVSTSFQIGPTLALAGVAATIDAVTGPGTGPPGLTSGLRAALVVPLAASLLGIAITAPQFTVRTPNSTTLHRRRHRGSATVR
jgi:MFS family permease